MLPIESNAFWHQVDSLAHKWIQQNALSLLFQLRILRQNNHSNQLGQWFMNRIRYEFRTRDGSSIGLVLACKGSILFYCYTKAVPCRQWDRKPLCVPFLLPGIRKLNHENGIKYSLIASINLRIFNLTRKRDAKGLKICGREVCYIA